MQRNWMGAALGAAVMALAGQAHALPMLATLTGEVQTDYGIPGLVTTPMAVGTPYTLTFAYDVQRGVNDQHDYGPGVYGQGGATATLTLGGASYVVDGTNFFSIQTIPQINRFAFVVDDGAFEIGAVPAVLPPLTNYLDEGYSWDSSQSSICALFCADVYALHRGYDLMLDVRTLTIARVPVVARAPEPAAWALMIGGFGLAGATLRWRRRQSTLAA
jgi:hypothetical protein